MLGEKDERPLMPRGKANLYPRPALSASLLASSWLLATRVLLPCCRSVSKSSIPRCKVGPRSNLRASGSVFLAEHQTDWFPFTRCLTFSSHLHSGSSSGISYE